MRLFLLLLFLAALPIHAQVPPSLYECSVAYALDANGLTCSTSMITCQRFTDAGLTPVSNLTGDTPVSSECELSEADGFALGTPRIYGGALTTTPMNYVVAYLAQLGVWQAVQYPLTVSTPLATLRADAEGNL
jgi:hypothetical protein